MPGIAVCKGDHTVSCMILKSVGEELLFPVFVQDLSVQGLTTNTKIHVGNVDVIEYNRLQEQSHWEKSSAQWLYELVHQAHVTRHFEPLYHDFFTHTFYLLFVTIFRT